MNDFGKDALIKKLEQENLTLRIDNHSLKTDIGIIFDELMPLVGEIISAKGWFKVFAIAKLAIKLVGVIIQLNSDKKEKSITYNRDYLPLN